MKSKRVHRKSKMLLYKTMIQRTLLQGSDIWTFFSEKATTKANKFEKKNSNQIIKWKQTYNLFICTFTLSHFKRKIWSWTGTRTQTSRFLAWHSTIELYLFQEEGLNVNWRLNQDSSISWRIILGKSFDLEWVDQ